MTNVFQFPPRVPGGARGAVGGDASQDVSTPDGLLHKAISEFAQAALAEPMDKCIPRLVARIEEVVALKVLQQIGGSND